MAADSCLEPDAVTDLGLFSFFFRAPSAPGAPVAAGADSHTPPDSPHPSPQPSSAVTYDHAARVAAAMGSGGGKQDLDAMTDFFVEQLHLNDPVKV